MGAGAKAVRQDKDLAAELGAFTFDDVIKELEKPGRDPRDAFVPFSFRADVRELKDLQPGMACPGIVTNVTNFGAFVDIGVHQDGLVHISHLADKFVKDPREVVSAGDRVTVRVLEVKLDKKQIALTMKSNARPSARQPRTPLADGPRRAARDDRRPASAERRERGTAASAFRSTIRSRPRSRTSSRAAKASLTHPGSRPVSPTIRRHALRDLVETARGLPLAATLEPVTCEAARVSSYAEELARGAAAGRAELVPISPGPGTLRPAVAELVARMARRAEQALTASLKRATEAWDQADALSVIDDDLEAEIAVARRRLTAGAELSAPASHRAVALEGLLAVDASVALVRIFERRLAALLRLRLRSTTPELLPEGLPFLDLGRALYEVAEAWR